jgi:SAM-dependent methyltransferase
VTVDFYAGAGRRWAEGATLVYGPIARLLVGMAPHPLQGREVLDTGAGTGVASDELKRLGAQPVAFDLSLDMLTWNAVARPPAAVADICALPVGDDAADDAVAAFVLNHLDEPERGLRELIRVTKPGGALLACVYSNENRSDARDAIDALAVREGWVVPPWYVDIKARRAPILGCVPAMESVASSCGLRSIQCVETAVDVGVTEAEQLVDYRFGQAHYAEWLNGLAVERAAEVRALAVDSARPLMTPYRPLVVFLSSVVA